MATHDDPPNVELYIGDYQTLMDKMNGYDGLVVLDFFTTWCPPCKVVASKLPDIFREYPNVHFIKIDRDNNDSLVRNDFQVPGVPCLKWFRKKDGKMTEVANVSGAEIEQIKSNMAQFSKE